MKFLTIILASLIFTTTTQAKIATADLQVTATIHYDCSSDKLEQMKSELAYIRNCQVQQASELKGAVVKQEGNAVSITY
ncbi:hypothetical protein LFL96_25845 [Paraburkholderia sp. D15]|uniref:hypothetical protein n=1 Tax=Paraburkholderia sp. D15 TaxID=2880218 RepID=UPI00247A87E2|nr:hypothetical protein [Paraburkholderia sp. D15]WGS54439.1 hypothetical protein LFL96_25845 [Paraburkholderia sp. D15]